MPQDIDGFMIRQAGQQLYEFRSGRSSDFTPSLDAEVRPAGPLSTLAGIVVESAPTVTARPTITGNTTVGSLLGGSVGSAEGNPSPSPAIFYERNGALIAGQTGGTLDTTGFSATDQVIKGVTWTNIVNGQNASVTARSDPFTLTVQPTLQGTISGPLVAGQPASITFNTAPDTVTGSVTLTRVGTTNEWTFTVPLDDTANVTIGGNKAGWDNFVENYDVLPAPASLAQEGTELVVQNVSNASVTIQVVEPARHAGTDTVSLADYSNGAIWLDEPEVVKNANTLTATPSLASWLDTQEPVQFATQWLRGTTALNAVPIAGASGLTYQIATDLDAGKNIYFGEMAETAQGQITSRISAPTAISAPAGLANGITEIGTFEGGNTASSQSTHTVDIPLGAADPGKTLYVWLAQRTAVSTASLNVNGTVYTATVLNTKLTPSSGDRLILLEIPCPAGGTGVLSVSGTLTTLRPRGVVRAAKGLTRVSSTDSAFTMTADTSFASSAGATQVGDTIMRGILTNVYNPSGIFSAATLLTETRDAPVTATGPQLWLGKGVETAASANRTLPITPNASGEYASIIVVLRSA